MRPESLRPPLTLPGRHVTLVPLTLAHRDALFAAARDPDVARYLGTSPGSDPAAVDRYVRLLLERQDAGTDLPFAIVRRSDERVVGATRYLRIDRPNDSVDIGTWIDPESWRTPVNSEAKYLLLRHAFESEGAHRVAFETDLRNERSQRAIARLGATREGILREDRIAPDGYRRSSVVYSILLDEWPRVRSRLERTLARPWPPPAPVPP